MSHFLVFTATEGVSDAVITQAIELLNAADIRLGTARRIGDSAVEIPFDGAQVLPNLDLLAGMIGRVDINVVPTENRRKKLLIADMDSTIIPVECIDELADYAGVKDHVADITERAMRGELDFEAALNERAALLADLPETTLQQCYVERIFLNPGAKTLVQTMNKLGTMTALVSGGFLFFTSRVAAEAGFQMNQANTLRVENGKITGKVGLPILGQQAKLEALHALCDSGGYTPADVLAVGDGANDRSMVQAAGLGVAYHAKQALADVAHARLTYSDLTALLALQGITEAEYA